MTIEWKLAGVAIAAAAATVPAQAQDASALYLRSLAATCANCHGTEGRSQPGAAVPTIAGLPRDYLSTQLKAFKAGTRPSTIMTQLAKGYTDAQLEQLAGYFAARP
jgi:cytochrome c553